MTQLANIDARNRQRAHFERAEALLGDSIFLTIAAELEHPWRGSFAWSGKSALGLVSDLTFTLDNPVLGWHGSAASSSHGTFMGWIRNSARAVGLQNGPPIVFVAAPLMLLSAVSFAIRSADSSMDFRLDQRWVLERLRKEIERQVPAIATAANAPEFREVREVVRRGDTFGSILRRLGIDSAEITRWSAASKGHSSLSRLSPGHGFAFLLPRGTDRLAALQYEVAPDTALIMRERGEAIIVEVERLEQTIDVMLASGTIDTNLYDAVVATGLPENLVSGLVDVFGWEIDFTTEIQRGDEFRVAYEEPRLANGKKMGTGRLLAAELTVRGRLYRAVYFESQDDGGRYYDGSGRPLGRTFLRYPLEFSRISSQFSTSRFHPILRRRRPHLGVDFAAPRGTPVRAIGSGRIELAGWKGGNGRYVRIAHGSGVESSYSHLNSIARGVRRGSQVQTGQVIGTVGATGLATGPHLHFAIWKNGRYVNPASADLPAGPSIEPRFLPAFAKTRDRFIEQLAALGSGSKPELAARIANLDLAAR